MSDPQDWVAIGVTAEIAPEDARRARYVVARAAIRRGWDSSAVRELIDALGLSEGRDGAAPGGGLFGCPSATARTRHVREGSDCRKCWPGGRQPLAIPTETAPERAIIGVGSEAGSHPAPLPDPNPFVERTG